ncbi:hypothetical protein AVEN_86048-1, partial [Araneus ventricosus]
MRIGAVGCEVWIINLAGYSRDPFGLNCHKHGNSIGVDMCWG